MAHVLTMPATTPQELVVAILGFTLLLLPQGTAAVPQPNLRCPVPTTTVTLLDPPLICLDARQLCIAPTSTCSPGEPEVPVPAEQLTRTRLSRDACTVRVEIEDLLWCGLCPVCTSPPAGGGGGVVVTTTSVIGLETREAQAQAQQQQQQQQRQQPRVPRRALRNNNNHHHHHHHRLRRQQQNSHVTTAAAANSHHHHGHSHNQHEHHHHHHSPNRHILPGRAAVELAPRAPRMTPPPTPSIQLAHHHHHHHHPACQSTTTVSTRNPVPQCFCPLAPQSCREGWTLTVPPVPTATLVEGCTVYEVAEPGCQCLGCEPVVS